MKPVLYIALALAARAAPQSPGAGSTANLPHERNNAGTGSSTLNTSNAVAAGQISDWSNPQPGGLPPAGAGKP